MITTPAALVSMDKIAPHLVAADATQAYFRLLWQSVESRARADSLTLRMLGVTSSLRGEGVSTVAVHLALAAARGSARRVLLADADFAQPSVHHAFGLTLEPGLADVLRERGACEADVHTTPLENLFVLTAGTINAKPSRAHDAMELGAAIKELAVDFDLVVFVMPPALETSFALRLAGLLDAVLLVVEAERVPAAVARRTVELLNRAHGHLLGAVLNKGSRPTSPLSQNKF